MKMCDELEQIDWSGSISSQAASLARILAALESRQESTESEAVYGLSSRESLGRFDRDTYSLKTSQGCLLTNQCDEYLATFPRSGLMQNGECFQLPCLERPMNESGSSLLPTPTRSMGQRGWGISKSGRCTYSADVIRNAAGFGYKPPIWLLEWEMGFPRDFTNPAGQPLETPSFLKSPNGSADE